STQLRLASNKHARWAQRLRPPTSTTTPSSIFVRRNTRRRRRATAMRRPTPKPRRPTRRRRSTWFRLPNAEMANGDETRNEDISARSSVHRGDYGPCSRVVVRGGTRCARKDQRPYRRREESGGERRDALCAARACARQVAHSVRAGAS